MKSEYGAGGVKLLKFRRLKFNYYPIKKSEQRLQFLKNIYKWLFLFISICFAILERRRQIVLREPSVTAQVVRIQAVQF